MVVVAYGTNVILDGQPLEYVREVSLYARYDDVWRAQVTTLVAAEGGGFLIDGDNVVEQKHEFFVESVTLDKSGSEIRLLTPVADEGASDV